MLLKLCLDKDFNTYKEGANMEVINCTGAGRGEGGGFSVVLAEKVLAWSRSLGLPAEWDQLGFGNVSHRSTGYLTSQRLSAVLAGLACGLRGVAPGNTVLRTNTAMQHATGGRFPDQGTIHRWLSQVTDQQAAALRSHLHEVVRDQGWFRDVLRSGRRLFVDVDAQGLVARGSRFERAAWGRLGGQLDCGYQRYVAYVGQTREVLDEFLRPGATTLLTELPEVLAGLNEVFPRDDRERVVIRADAHGGTVNNLRALKTAGYSYVCRMLSRLGINRLRREVCVAAGQPIEVRDSTNTPRRLTCWDVPDWTIRGRDRRPVHSRAVLYHEVLSDGREFWLVLLTNLTDLRPDELWSQYHQRSGTIEEYNDQSERAFHLEVVRTGCAAGHNALLALVGLCWNLTVWCLEDLRLPPVAAPQADNNRWISALEFDRSAVLQRAAQSGLRLFRPHQTPRLEVEDTACNPESTAWLRWLGGTIQIRLHLVA